jgi:hypothetical protein
MSLHIYADVEQRSEAWYAARCGIVTASAVGQLITVGPPDALTVVCPTCEAASGAPCLAAGRKVPTPIKTVHGPRSTAASNLPPVIAPATGDTALSLIALLASERIANHVEQTWTSNDMWRGIDAEPYARDAYAQWSTEGPVSECGFMVRDFGSFSIGYSPDGLVGDDGLLEIKAPRQKGHVSTVVGDQVPAAHMAQLQTGLLVSGRKWIDFVSYSSGLHLWPKRVTPDPRWHEAILLAAEEAEAAINELVAAYEQAVVDLPLTERIDFNAVELKLA